MFYLRLQVLSKQIPDLRQLSTYSYVQHVCRIIHLFLLQTREHA